MNTSDRCSDKLEEIRIGVCELRRSVGRLRHVRFTGLICVIFIGVAIGAAAVSGWFYREYRDAKRAEAFLARFRDAGLDVRFVHARDGAREVTVTGGAGTFVRGTRLDDSGGVTLQFRGPRQ